MKPSIVWITKIGLLICSNLFADEPTKRPPVEPAEQVLRRRGNVMQSPYRVPVVTTNQLRSLEIRKQISDISTEFGTYTEIDGQVVYRSGNVRIQDAVRKIGSEVFVLGKRLPAGWAEFPKVRINRVLPDGVVVNIVGDDHMVRDIPGAKSFFVGAILTGYFAATSERAEIIGPYGITLQIPVWTYGIPVVGQEAIDAISRVMRERELEIGHLKAEENAIKDEATRKREEAVAKFRAEQESRHARESQQSTAPSQ